MKKIDTFIKKKWSSSILMHGKIRCALNFRKGSFLNENWGSDPPYAIFSAFAELPT